MYWLENWGPNPNVPAPAPAPAASDTSGAAPDYTAQAGKMYQDTFGRAGDAEGIGFWAGELAKGRSASDVGSQFAEVSRSVLDNYARTGQNQYSDLLDQDLAVAGTAGTFTGGDRRSTAEKALEGGVFEKLYGSKPATRAPATPALSTQPWKDATQWNVTPNQTVAGQIETIIAKDSPLMQQARTRALQRQNANGTLNSSMAISAGESAMYDAAMPIANADASMYGNAAQTNANTANAFSRDFNQWQREREMANFNLGANDWAADRGLAREIELRGTRSADDAAGLERGYINAITQARTDYAEKLAGISARTDMDSDLKKETLLNLRASYNTMIENFAGLLGWNPDSWIIKVSENQTGTPAPAAAPAPAADVAT